MDIYSLYCNLSQHIDTYIKFLKNSNEIVLRCPFCGDSIKHLNKGHFYIGESHGAMLYHCKRAGCNASGIVNKTLLDALYIHDIKLISSIIKHNDNLSSNAYIKRHKLQYINQHITNTNPYLNYNFNNIELKKLHTSKIKYLNNRLYKNENTKYNGFELNLNQFRIILSIKHFVDTYQLLPYLNTYQKSQLDYLDKSCIGFLNMTGSCITFRTINNDAKYRYFKLKLNDNCDLYAIDNNLDLLQSNHITLNLCEGSIDLINIKNRLSSIFNFNCNNDVFICVNGSDYRTKVEFFSKYSGLLNFNIRIFRDNDMPYKILKRQFYNSLYHIEVYSNTLSKDYSEDKIFLLRDIK